MRTTRIGSLDVSLYGLGTMTWGSQNTPEEAYAQIDAALDRGVTLLDTAEMYPTTPMTRETMGRTEEIIGDWLVRSGRRGDVVLATKIVGAGSTTARGGEPIGPETLRIALEGSLRRLRTEAIDLYQLHWPNRGSYHFRGNWDFAPEKNPRNLDEDLLATLETLSRFRKEGKIREIGLSNDSAWGVMRMRRLAEAHGYPKPVSIQNEYSLLCRHFDLDLAEVSWHEDVPLLAYSPLAAGLLTGKYEGGAMPGGSRATIRENLNGRMTEAGMAAASAYAALAREHGLDPAHLALAFAASRPFMGSVLLGATSTAQLLHDLGAAEISLGEDVQAGIDAIRRRYPVPY